MEKTLRSSTSAMPLLPTLNASAHKLTIVQPDVWHLHLRDGGCLPHSASVFKRAIVMPNLKPPVTTVASAIAYKQRILRALPKDTEFEPLMTLYLTDDTTPREIVSFARDLYQELALASFGFVEQSGAVVAVKLYPAGATTNSQAGVTHLFGKCIPVLEELSRQRMPLLVHGEVADPDIDVFDREKTFISTVLNPLVKRLPSLKIVLEHITTRDAVDFVESCTTGNVAATITPQHFLLNRNAIFRGGVRPHYFCLPVLKREEHRQALLRAVSIGSRQYFLGTDSAPHEKSTKESSCGCRHIQCTYRIAVVCSSFRGGCGAR